MDNRPHNHTLTKLTPRGVGEVASLQGWAQVSPMVMDSKGEIMAHPKAPLSKTTERVEMVAVATEVVAAAAAVVVTQTGGLFTPAAAKAPVKVEGVAENIIRRKNLNVLRCLT